MTKKKRYVRRVGDIVKIDLGADVCAYGRVLVEPLMAFYSIKSCEQISLGEIVKSRILFKIWVMNSALTSDFWKAIGNLPLDGTLQEDVDFFKIDAISKSYSIYRSGEEIQAKREDCMGLERAAVWSASHVEDRLRDYFAGVPNKWQKLLAP